MCTSATTTLGLLDGQLPVEGGGGELLVDAQPARPCSWHAAHPLFQNIGDGPARLLALSHFWHGRFFEGVTLLPSDSFDSAVLGYSIVGYAALLV